MILTVLAGLGNTRDQVHVDFMQATVQSLTELQNWEELRYIYH